MFGGILAGIIRGMFFIGEDIKSAHESNVSQRRSIREGRDTYFDASGRQRDTATSKKVILCYNENMDYVKEDYHGNVLRNYTAEKRAVLPPKRYNPNSSTTPMEYRPINGTDGYYKDGYNGQHYRDKETGDIYAVARMNYRKENDFKSINGKVYVNVKTHKAVRLTDDSCLKFLGLGTDDNVDMKKVIHNMSGELKRVNDLFVEEYDDFASKNNIKNLSNLERMIKGASLSSDSYSLKEV